MNIGLVSLIVLVEQGRGQGKDRSHMIRLTLLVIFKNLFFRVGYSLLQLQNFKITKKTGI